MFSLHIKIEMSPIKQKGCNSFKPSNWELGEFLFFVLPPAVEGLLYCRKKYGDGTKGCRCWLIDTAGTVLGLLGGGALSKSARISAVLGFL